MKNKLKQNMKIIGVLLIIFFTMFAISGCQKVEQGPEGPQGPTGDNGVSITHIEINDANELIITFSDSTTINLGDIKGVDGVGIDGMTPYIGENGNWWIGDNDLEVFAGNKNTTISQTGNFEFAVNSDGMSYYLYKYTGNDRFINIPKYFSGYPVSAIGMEAFMDNQIIQELYIPNTIVDIESGAFSGISNLKTVTFEEGSHLTSIEPYAFANTNNLKNIVIPNSVTNIGENAFKDSGLETVTFEKESQLTEIGPFSFCFTGSLISIEIPKSVINIQAYAFNYSGIEIITFEKESQLKSIGFYSFADTIRLKSITIPNSVTIIDDYAFRDSSLETLKFEEGSNLITIGEYTFANTVSLISIVIPHSVTTIKKFAFLGADSLTIFSETPGVVLSWSPNWNHNNRPVYWLGEWHYDLNGNPIPN